MPSFFMARSRFLQAAIFPRRRWLPSYCDDIGRVPLLSHEQEIHASAASSKI